LNAALLVLVTSFAATVTGSAGKKLQSKKLLLIFIIAFLFSVEFDNYLKDPDPLNHKKRC
jgi:hypothetical protein